MSQVIGRSVRTLPRVIIFLHVGAAKTGTTFLQRVLAANRRTLLRQGVSYPGDSVDHFIPALDVTKFPFGVPDFEREGAWTELAEQAHASGAPRGFISHEILTRATPEQVDEALAPFADDEVHLVYTVRDVSRAIPAIWQEKLKNREELTLENLVTRMRRRHAESREDRTPFPMALNEIDLAGTVSTWSRRLRPENVHIVTLPEGGSSGVLWERIAALLGVDAASAELPERSNASFGRAEAEFLRLFNLRSQEGDIDFQSYHRFIKHRLAIGTLAERTGSVRIQLGPDDMAWAGEFTADQRRYIEESGFDVAGDLDDLTPPPPGAEPPEITTDQLLDVALDTGVGLLAQLRDTYAESRGLASQLLASQSGAGRALRRARSLLRRWR